MASEVTSGTRIELRDLNDLCLPLFDKFFQVENNPMIPIPLSVRIRRREGEGSWDSVLLA